MTNVRPLERTTTLDDLTFRTTGDGVREIVAYAAVFNTPAEVRDHEGHYMETLAGSVFDRTLDHHPDGRGIRVLFNHGRDLYGNPAERFAMPYGTPSEMRADGTGLLTVTRVANTPLGDEVHELARTGAIDGLSFTARAVEGGTTRRPADDPLGLPTFERTELALVEYGLGVFPVYEDARVLQVRATDLALQVSSWSEEERAAFLRALSDTLPDPSAGPPGTGDDGDSSDPLNPVLVVARARRTLTEVRVP